MDLLRRPRPVLVVVLVAVLLPLVNSGPAAAQPAGPSSWPVCSSEDTVRVLMLMDASGSLKTTDPDQKRRVGARAAARAMSELAAEYPEVPMQIAVASFDSSDRIHAWWTPINAGTSSEVLDAVDAAISDGGEWTDYGDALGSAVDLFERTRQPDDPTCDVMLWFTDGAHDTADGDSRSERVELDSICAAGGPTDYLASVGVFAVAVELSGPGYDASGVLRRLVGGTGAGDCSSVPGLVVSADSPDSLRQLLEDVVRSLAWSAAERVPQMGSCEHMDGSECRLSFSVSATDDGFEFYADTSALSGPDRENIGMNVTAPDGTDVSISWPQIETDGTLLEGLPVLAERPSAPGWRVLRAHQALAWDQVPAGQVPDPWVGTWEVSFYGPGSASIAVTVRQITNGPVESDLRRSGPSLVASVEGAGDRAMRLSLPTSPPLYIGSLAEGGERFSSDSCAQHVAQEWMVAESVEIPNVDSEVVSLVGPSSVAEASGGMSYRMDVMECVEIGPVEVAWARPESVSVLESPVPDVFWRPAAELLATVDRVAPDGRLTDTADLVVHASPGVYETVLTLPSASDSLGLVPQTDGPVPRGPAKPDRSASQYVLSVQPPDYPGGADWECVVPPSDGTGASFECPVLRMAVDVDDGVESHSGTTELSLTAAVPAPVLSSLGYDGQVVSTRDIRFAYDFHRPDPAAMALGLLRDVLLLVGLWAMFKVLRGLRIRPWDPSPAAVAAVAEVSTDGGAPRLGAVEWEFCPAVNARKSKAAIGPVRVVSGLMHAVTTGSRVIEAHAASGASLVAQSPQSSSLDGGWALVDASDAVTLVVWGLSGDEAEHASEVREAFGAARYALEDRGPGPPDAETKGHLSPLLLDAD